MPVANRTFAVIRNSFSRYEKKFSPILIKKHTYRKKKKIRVLIISKPTLDNIVKHLTIFQKKNTTFASDSKIAKNGK